jgi:hypothetical protein
MLLEHDICRASRINDSEELDKFISNNSDKIITRLNWSPSKKLVTKQIKFAISNNASFVLSEIFPDEFPNTLLNKEIKFICKTLKLIKPNIYKQNIDKKIEQSMKNLFLINNDEIDYLSSKDKCLPNLLDLIKVQNQNQISIVDEEILDIERFIRVINSYRKVIILSEYPQFIDFVVRNILDFEKTIIKVPYYSPKYSRSLLSKYVFLKNSSSDQFSIRSRFRSFFEEENDVKMKSLNDNKSCELDESKRLEILESLHKHEFNEYIWTTYTNSIVSDDSPDNVTRVEKKLFYTILNIECPKYIEKCEWNTYKKSFAYRMIDRLINSSRTYGCDQEFRYIIENYLSEYDYSSCIIQLLNKYLKLNQNIAFLTLELFLCHSKNSQFETLNEFGYSLFNSLNLQPDNEFYLAKKLFILDSINLDIDEELLTSFNKPSKRFQLQVFIRMLPIFCTVDFIIKFLKNKNLSPILQNSLLNGYFYANNLSETDLFYGCSINFSNKKETREELISIICTLDIKTHFSAMIQICLKHNFNDIEKFYFFNNYTKIQVILNLLKKSNTETALSLFKTIKISSLNNYELVILCSMQKIYSSKFSVFNFSIEEKVLKIAQSIQTLDSHHIGLFTYLYRFFESFDNNKSDTYKRIAESSEYNHLSILKYWKH